MRGLRSFLSLRFMALFISALLLIIIGACLWAGGELASPPRRALQDYHREFLAAPASHGVVVKAFTISDGTPCLLVEPSPDGKLGPRGLRLREQFASENLALPAPGQIIGTLVLIHGRKGRKEDYLLIAERLCAAGFRCLLPDMPAHGEHPAAHATFGVSEAKIPLEVLSQAAKQYQFPARPAGLLGMSMGGAISMRAAALPDQPWQALVIISSFDRIVTAIEKNVSDRVGPTLGQLWTQAAGWVYTGKTGVPLMEIRSDQAAQQIKIPTLIAHGTADRVIPHESGQRLFTALPPDLEKQWVDVPKADHDNVLITDFPIYATITRWMLRHVK